MKAKLIAFYKVLADGVSLRTKVIAVILALILLLGVVVTIQARMSLRASLGQRLDRQGISIARDVAARGADYVLTNNLYTLYELVKDTLNNNEDVRYVFIVDPKGEVLVHTFNRGLPKGIRQANTVAGSERFSKKILETNEGLVHDIAVPIFEGRGGTVRVGINEGSLQKALKDTTERLLSIIILVSVIGAGVAVVLTAVLISPLKQMVRVTEEVAAGNLQQTVNIWWARDELAQLGLALNHMIESLGKSRDDVDNFSQQIIKRNKELAAYNAIAVTIGQSLDLKVILDAILEHITEIMQICYGEIYILDREGEKFTLIVGGTAQQGTVLKTKNDFSQEFIGEVMKKGEPVIVRDVQSDQRLVGIATCEGKASTMVALPLKAKTSVVGVMNLYWSNNSSKITENIQLLTTLSTQIGVAIENALLWQELKTKEALRTLLLEKVITAQEEERKRIARELHDQTSQSVAYLMMGLELLEKVENLGEIKERVEDLRFITNSVLGDLHDLALELRPSVLDDLGLEAALQRCTKEWSGKFRINIDLHCYGLLNSRLPAQVELTVYRVVQEALTNIAKYAQANSVSIIVERKKSVLTAIVEDNGAGFEVDRVLASPLKDKKLGIFGMAERVSVIGGDFTIESEPGTGTTVYVKIPMEEVISHG
ncbi:MAG: GAF domain-containing protein [Clostridia bacterium]|nr:GAF domain-containing protein [Clostridia bacterium]